MSPSPITNLRPRLLLLGRSAGQAGKKLRLPVLVAAGLCIANLLIYFSVLSPAAAGLAGQQDAYGAAKRRYAEAILFQKQRKALEGISAGMTTQKDIPLLIKDLVQSARKLHLSVGAVNSDTPARGKAGLDIVTFTVPVEGSYANIKRYIYEVETTARLVGIRDLRLSSDKGRVKLDMKLVTYIQGG